MGRLLVLFIGVPVLELALLIEIGSRIGTLATVGLIALTGVVGAALARRQGLSVMRRLRTEVDAGHPPAEALVDGALILVAGALLMTPGVLTDAVGFACLVPGVRALVKRDLWRRLERAAQEGRVAVFVAEAPPGAGPPPAGDPREVWEPEVREVRDVREIRGPGEGGGVR